MPPNSFQQLLPRLQIKRVCCSGVGHSRRQNLALSMGFAAVRIARSLSYRKSSAVRPLPSMILFKVPIGIGLLPWIATMTCRPFRVTPLLMTPFLANESEAVLSQDTDNLARAANRQTLTHWSVTSSTFAAGIEAGDGSNHSSKASFALRTASSSVRPRTHSPAARERTLPSVRFPDRAPRPVAISLGQCNAPSGLRRSSNDTKGSPARANRAKTDNARALPPNSSEQFDRDTRARADKAEATRITHYPEHGHVLKRDGKPWEAFGVRAGGMQPAMSRPSADQPDRGWPERAGGRRRLTLGETKAATNRPANRAFKRRARSSWKVSAREALRAINHQLSISTFCRNCCRKHSTE